MAQTNVAEKAAQLTTAQGAKAAVITAEQQLRRSVLACMLWEDEFYEDGRTIAERIRTVAEKLPFNTVANIAIEAREKAKLRHAPLWLAVALAPRKAGRPMGDLLARIIQRPDEITEFLALYSAGRKDRKKLNKLAKQVKIGLARAFRKFNEYELAKYDRDGLVKLRDALFLSHAKPKDVAEDAARWDRDARKAYDPKKGFVREFTPGELLQGKLVHGVLETPDTWETNLSAGADKKETFERLMSEKKLGALAFLRNLRNMKEAGVSKTAVAHYSTKIDLSRVLPFRFISAAKAVPEWEDVIEPMMLAALAGQPKLAGRTRLLIDGSGSMDQKVSAKSDISRRDAAIAVAILLRELCEDVQIIGFSTEPWAIPPRRGFALRDAINAKVVPASTYLGKAVAFAQKDGPADRIIVITDEQSHDNPPAPKGTGYVINVASAQNGLGYGKWLHIDGWSEAIIDYIRAYEESLEKVAA